jgi:hypothetical protein
LQLFLIFFVTGIADNVLLCWIFLYLLTFSFGDCAFFSALFDEVEAAERVSSITVSQLYYTLNEAHNRCIVLAGIELAVIATCNAAIGWIAQ